MKTLSLSKSNYGRRYHNKIAISNEHLENSKFTYSSYRHLYALDFVNHCNYYTDFFAIIIEAYTKQLLQMK